MRGVDQKLLSENGCASINSKEVVLETECATYSNKHDCESILHNSLLGAVVKVQFQVLVSSGARVRNFAECIFFFLF